MLSKLNPRAYLRSLAEREGTAPNDNMAATKVVKWLLGVKSGQ